MQHHVTIALPPGISITNARNALHAVETAAREALNDDTLEAHLSDGLALSDQERRVICSVFDLAHEAQEYAGRYGVVANVAAEVLADLRARLDPDDIGQRYANHVAQRPEEHSEDER